MMGQQPRTDSLFYYFRLEDQIPDDHLLKRLDRFIDFGFVRERLRDTYSAIGRPSIDPEGSCCAFCWWAICMESPVKGG
jgi:transposase